jgi:hypothetical protein
VGVPSKILESVLGIRVNVLKFCDFKLSGSRNKLTEVTQAEKMDIKTVMCVSSRVIVESAHFMVVKKLVLFKMFI